ncbi:MAG: O-antigen ligase family protein [Solirubrobacterales bacterium]
MERLVYRLSLVFIFSVAWEGLVRFPGIGTLAKLVGLTLGLCWAANAIMTGRIRRPDPFVFAAGAFVMWVALSVFWSADETRSILHVFTWVQALGLVIVLWDVYRTRAAVRAGLQAYVLGAYVAVGGAIANYFGSNPFYTHYDRFSLGDTNPDGFGFIIALGIPVAWYLASSVGTTRAQRMLRALNFVFIPAAFLGLALSGTRTAAVAAGVGMVFGLVSLTRLRPVARIAILLALVYAFYALLPVVAPLKSFQRLGTTATEATQGDLNGRLDQWRQGLESFGQHPFIGVGTDMYRSVNTLDKVAHNSFVSILVELGLIGFVLFGVVLATVVLHALGQPRWDRNFWLTVLVVWTLGASTLTWEYRKTTWVFFTLLVASAAVARSERASRRAASAELATASGATGGDLAHAGIGGAR